MYFVALNISSNFFFNVAASPSGQLLSSWWTNTTFSRIALLTPIISGTVALMSAHLRLTLTFSPSSLDRLYDLVEIFLLELTAALLRQLEGSGHDARLRANVAESKLDLRLDLGDVCHLRVVDESLSGPRARRKLAGRRHLQAFDHRLRVGVGGNGAGVRDAVGSEGRERRRRTWQPSAARSEILATLVWVGDYRRTVFPAPLRPTISVRGFGKMIAWSLSGLKLRMPLMSILSTEQWRGLWVQTTGCRRIPPSFGGRPRGGRRDHRRDTDENGARACPERNARPRLRPLRYCGRRVACVCRRLRWPRSLLMIKIKIKNQTTTTIFIFCFLIINIL